MHVLFSRVNTIKLSAFYYHFNLFKAREGKTSPLTHCRSREGSRWCHPWSPRCPPRRTYPLFARSLFKKRGRGPRRWEGNRWPTVRQQWRRDEAQRRPDTSGI